MHPTQQKSSSRLSNARVIGRDDANPHNSQVDDGDIG